MTRCGIMSCSSKKDENHPRLTLHRLPRNKSFRIRWLDVIGSENLNPSVKDIYICSLHFEESCFNRTLDVARLQDNSIPSLHLQPQPPATPSTSGISTSKCHDQPLSPTDTAQLPATPSTSGISTSKYHDQPSSPTDMQQPPALRSTLRISTSKSHDQPSSATDMAKRRRCSVPFCVSGVKTSWKSNGISFYKFPKDPNILKKWVKALGIQNWEAKSSHTICSEHFKEESFYETMHGRMMLHPDAIPIKDLDLDAPAALTVCRICLKVDPNMKHIGTFSEVFHRITGLLASDSESCRLPQLLCWECAARLEAADTFRQKALRSDAILRDLLKPDTFIRIRDIKTINRKSNRLKTSLVQTLIDSERYDVNIQDTFIDTDDIKTEYDLDEGIPELLENNAHNDVTNNFKANNSEESNTNIKTKAFEKKPETNENYKAIEDMSNICHSDNKRNSVMLQKGNEKSKTKYDMLKNNDEESKTKFVIFQNSAEESDAQYMIVQNGDEQNNLKYIMNGDEENSLKYMMQNDNTNEALKTEDSVTLQDNEIVTEETNDEDLFEEYLYFDDDTTEILGETDNPEEISKITYEENHEEFDLGVQNVEDVRQNKTVSRVLKNPARKMDKSRAVSGQNNIEKESDIQNVVVQNGDEGNNLKYTMLQNDDCNTEDPVTIQNNDVVTEERDMSEDMLEEQKKIKYEDTVVYENLFDITDLTIEQQREEIFKRWKHDSYINAPYKCTECFTGFRDKPVFDRHVLKHTDTSGKFECTICKIRKKSRKLLNSHLIMSHTKEYKCLQCDYVTRNSKCARDHVQYHKGKRYICEQCPLVFDKCSSYFSHMRLVHVNSCVCDYCGYTFVSQRGVRIHKNLLHKLEKNLELKGPYCKECDVTFLTKDAYSRHLKLSSKHLRDESDPLRIRNEPKYAPKNRMTIFKTRTSKNIYEQRNSVTCEQCGIEIPNYRSYTHHFIRCHPGLTRTQYPVATPLVCEQCGKMFSHATSLACHKWVHTGKKNYQCDHCEKSFTQKTKLIDHMNLVKDGGPKHQCAECGKIFVSSTNLKRHVFIHTGLNPFKCDMCSKSFNTNSSLYQHKQHTHFKVPWPRKKKPKITEE